MARRNYPFTIPSQTFRRVCSTLMLGRVQRLEIPSLELDLDLESGEAESLVTNCLTNKKGNLLENLRKLKISSLSPHHPMSLLFTLRLPPWAPSGDSGWRRVSEPIPVQENPI